MHIWDERSPGGVLIGFAAVGIDPRHFSLQPGHSIAVRTGLATAVDAAAYL